MRNPDIAIDVYACGRIDVDDDVKIAAGVRFTTCGRAEDGDAGHAFAPKLGLVGLGGGETTSRFISALEIELGASPYSCVPKSRYPKAKLVQSASTSRLIMTFSCC